MMLRHLMTVLLAAAVANVCVAQPHPHRLPAVVEQQVPINLPTALAMVSPQHPSVGLAKWRLQEAYAKHERAKVLWLPSIQAGLGFNRHDGNFQASNGNIVDINRNSFQYGLGTGAAGAGTTPNHGIVAQFHLADAIFEPKITSQIAQARKHAVTKSVNDRLRDVATAYVDLLEAYQDTTILTQSQERFDLLHKITADFAEAGEGLLADADRVQTEKILAENRLLQSQQQMRLASARLIQATSMEAGATVVPADPTVLPIDLISATGNVNSLVATGLSTRPELREASSLVAAACQAYTREKKAVLLPSVLLGFSTGGFGGGLGNNLDDVDSRYDFDALLTWKVRNLGFGERAARRESASRVQQQKFRKLALMDRVAREVSEAHTQVVYRGQQIEVAQRAIESAESSVRRNLDRIRDGEGLPLEVLQSIQSLEVARRAYLKAVSDYNRSQYQLQWALGWPVS